MPSFGGFNGSKLGEQCTTAQALAAQYLRVVDQFNLAAIDIDIEANEFDNDASRNRVVDALKLVKQQRPSLITIVTMPTTVNGLSFAGTQLVNRAASTQANIDVFTIMPFDFGAGNNMFNATVSATNGLNTALRNAFGWSQATAYARSGISGMNGLSDQSELTSPATWTQIRDFAAQNHLARLSFWGVNRDRPCPGQAVRLQLQQHRPERLAVHLDHRRLPADRESNSRWGTRTSGAPPAFRSAGQLSVRAPAAGLRHLAAQRGPALHHSAPGLMSAATCCSAGPFAPERRVRHPWARRSRPGRPLAPSCRRRRAGPCR